LACTSTFLKVAKSSTFDNTDVIDMNPTLGCDFDVTTVAKLHFCLDCIGYVSLHIC